ncbi:MAG: exodeoxyribonuclease V subunit beta [Deltaproteobacteria bacterium]|nr:exodeoxyribonuclease V subunit beta [Deltaproteobacteria bacterium]
MIFQKQDIEASAGTGKTHTISFLFLRLILEKKLTIDRILVVTFTQAATQELKDRVFNLLLKTREAVISGKSNDPLIDTLVKQREKNHKDIETLQNAISDFDKASIFTIHGFCNRILKDNAFETATRFDEELVEDPNLFLQEVTNDFWRKNVYQSPVEFVSYIYNKIKGPDYFLSLLNKVNALEIEIIPSIEDLKIHSLTPYRNTFKKLRKLWNEFREDILVLLTEESLKGNIYGALKSNTKTPDTSGRDLKIRSIAKDMDLFIDKRYIGFPLFKKFQLFTANKLKHSVKNEGVPPSHIFYDVCDDLFGIASTLEKEFEARLLYLKGYVFKYTYAELDKRKNDRNIRFFNDLILKVRSALKNSAVSDQSFIREIREKYKAALVDEFQDTDSVQYEIFSNLFSSKENILFMIGDPKQAIYSFRGADVFSYMEAARNAESTYTLIENWRSSKKLIAAVNTFFSNIKQPFIFKDILFDRGRSATNEMSDHQTDIAPVKIWFVDSKSEKPLNKSDAEKIAAKAVVNEVALLISTNKNKCKEQFKEGDVAILVRTNRQAMIMKNHLSQGNINSVLFSTGDIFETNEAYEMERLLAAFDDPVNEKKLKSALCTDSMGVPGDMLDSQGEELKWFEDTYRRFKNYKRMWQEKGFTHMFNQFLISEAVKQRLLSYPNGERRITNILHLSEILQQESVNNKRGMASIIKWFSEQRDPRMLRKDKNQLHLESDRRAVNIVTMHKSKGLEYPVVFCPFAWEGMLKQDDDILFHNDDDEHKLIFDLRGSESGSHLVKAQREKLAENMRLFYVAVTRAKKACYLTWGNINSADTSPISYLLYGDEIDNDADILNSLKNYFSSKRADELLSDLQQFSSRSEGTIEVLKLTGMKQPIKIPRKERIGKNLFCRKFHKHIDTSWKILSYSSLVSEREKESDLPDHDTLISAHPNANLVSSEDTHIKDDSIFSFPKGAKAGIFFHDLLENLDFTCKESKKYEELVYEKLQSYGFDLKWKNTVCKVIDNILSVPLIDNNTTLKLAFIENKNRINEMEFYYPINKITPEKIINLFSKFNGVDSSKHFPAHGFMKGYIDLVFYAGNKFYLIDWKSNFLGLDIENYKSEFLVDVMNHTFYTLQYHIYTLALHQYLSYRYAEYTYEQNFGGIFYIFLRGVDENLGPDYGIYTDFPDPGLLNNMGKILMPKYKMV